MSRQEGFEAGKEARRTMLHDAGHAEATGDRMDALLRYLKGSGQGRSTGVGRAKPLSDAEIRSQAVKHVVDCGGEVTAAIMVAGSLRLRGWIAHRSEIALLEQKLSEIPGVARLDLRLRYDIDDL